MGKRGRPAHPDILTPREWKVLGLLRERLTNEQIADRLDISLDGAKYHVSSILSKLGASSREEAAAWMPTEVRPWWKRLVVVPAAVLGTATLVGASAGLALLAWGAVETSGPAQEVAGRTATPGGEDSIEPTWSPEERAAIEPVLDMITMLPCKHLDKSSARATLTTMDKFPFLLRQRMFPNEVIAPNEKPWVAGTENITPSSTPVWLVEVKTDQSSPVLGNEETCEPPAMPMVEFVMVVDGEPTASWGRPLDQIETGSDSTTVAQSPTPSIFPKSSLDPGMRVVELNVPPTTEAGTRVSAGDWVDIQAVYYGGAVSTIVESVQVLSVALEQQRPDGPDITSVGVDIGAAAVAVAVTPQDLQLITSAQENATKLVLSRSSDAPSDRFQ